MGWRRIDYAPSARPIQLPGFPRAAARTLGELQLAGVPLDALAAVARVGPDLAALAREMATTAGRPLTLQLDDRLGAVRADPTRVRMLLRNLIENAQRHAAEAPQAPAIFLRREADGQLALGLRPTLCLFLCHCVFLPLWMAHPAGSPLP